MMLVCLAAKPYVSTTQLQSYLETHCCANRSVRACRDDCLHMCTELNGRFDVVNYTDFSLRCRNVQARKRSEWVWQRWEGRERCDDLGYSYVGSATALCLMAEVGTTPHAWSSSSQLQKNERKAGDWANGREMLTVRIRWEKTSHPHNLSQLSPPTLFFLSIFLYFLPHFKSFPSVLTAISSILPPIFLSETVSLFSHGWKLIKMPVRSITLFLQSMIYFN